MREYEDCLRALLARLRPLTQTETIPLCRAAGRVCASEVTAPIAVPSFPKSAMDGYAVRACDIQGARKEHPVRLTVRQTLYAGDYSSVFGAVRSCVRVMTGAFVPPPFDTVVMQEDTDGGADTVQLFVAQEAGKNYCAIGEDIAQGAVLAHNGDVLSGVQIGLLASVGLTTVRVRKRVRVAVLVTGNEVVQAGKPLPNGKIYDSVGVIIRTVLETRSITTVRLEYCADERAKITRAIKKWSKKADIIITSGGISVGEKDYVAVALEAAGAETVFAGVAVRPGSPTRASLVQGIPVLSLSGNPFAALAHVSLFVDELLAGVLSAPALKPKTYVAVLQHDWHKVRPVRSFVRARYENGTVTIPHADHHASVIANLTDCNCLADIPANTVLHAGARVHVRVFSW